MKVKWLLDLKKNWVRKELSDQTFFNEKEWVAWQRTIYFDGSELKVFEPRGLASRRPEMTIQTRHFGHLLFSPLDAPVFLSHGIVNSAKGVPTPQRLSLPIEADQFAVRGSSLLNGINHLVIRTAAQRGTFYEYWVDGSKQAFIGRFAIYSDGILFIQVDIWPKQTEWGWLPDKWEVSSYLQHRDIPDRREQLAVRALLVNPQTKIEDFQIHPTGDVILRDLKARITYRAWHNSWEPYALVFLLVVACALIVLWFRRRRRSVSKTGPG